MQREDLNRALALPCFLFLLDFASHILVTTLNQGLRIFLEPICLYGSTKLSLIAKIHQCCIQVEGAALVAAKLAPTTNSPAGNSHTQLKIPCRGPAACHCHRGVVCVQHVQPALLRQPGRSWPEPGHGLSGE